APGASDRVAPALCSTWPAARQHPRPDAEIDGGEVSFATSLTVAVGTCVSSHAPPTEPYVGLSRIRLPPRVCDGKAVARPRMEDDRFWEPAIHQLRHPCPRDPILLAAT